MTGLEQLRADQHNDVALPSDHALYAFLAECDPATAALDRAPRTQIEIRHFAHVKDAA